MEPGMDRDFADFAAARSGRLLGLAHVLTANPLDLAGELR